MKRSAVAVVLLVAACRSDAAPSNASPAAAADPVAKPVPPKGPPEVELPRGACKLTTASSLHGVPLRLAAGGPVYGTAGSSYAMMGGLLGAAPAAPKPTFSVDLVFADGEAKSAGLRYRTPRLDVKGLVDPADVEIHPARAEVIDGYRIQTRVRIARVTGHRAEIEPVFDGEIEPVAAPAAVPVACANLSLDEPASPRSLAPPSTRGPHLQLRAGATDLALSPGGPPIARLHATDDSDAVEVLERRGAATRILWYRDAAIVFGWVPSSSLSKSRNDRTAIGRSMPRHPDALAAVRCERDVPLLAAVGDLRMIVGAVRAGATIEVAERAGASARIYPVTAARRGMGDVEPASGATFWVEDAAIQGCPAAPPPPPEDDAMIGIVGSEGLGDLLDGKSLGDLGTRAPAPKKSK